MEMKGKLLRTAKYSDMNAKLQSCNWCRIIGIRSLLWILTCPCSVVCPEWALMRKTATRCNALQHAAPHCTTLHHNATHYYTLQYTATHCNTPCCSPQYKQSALNRHSCRHTATHCNTAPQCNTLQYNATHWIETLANTPAALHISPSRYTVRERAPCRPYVRRAPVSRTQHPCHFTAVQHSATQCNTVQHTWHLFCDNALNDLLNRYRNFTNHFHFLQSCNPRVNLTPPHPPPPPPPPTPLSNVCVSVHIWDCVCTSTHASVCIHVRVSVATSDVQ